MIYAGIGARATPTEVLSLMQSLAYIYAINGYECRTGAAKGADQAFANGANTAGGKLTLCIPWGSYEQAWFNTLQRKNLQRQVLHNSHTDAFDSVRKYHPYADKLKQGAMKLHARNYLIIVNVETGALVNFIICWTPGGQIKGGTGQALRLAKDLGIEVINLGVPEIYKQYSEYVNSQIGNSGIIH